MNIKPKIVIDVERMKHPYTGLYFYCRNLSFNLIKLYSKHFDIQLFKTYKVKIPSFVSQLTPFNILFNRKIDLWHATWQHPKYLPGSKTKLIYTIHDLNFLYTDKPENKKKKLLNSIQKVIDKADVITVISNFVKQEVQRELNTDGKKIVVIYNGVEVNTYPNFDTPKYRPKGKFLFSLGTLLFKKHFHVLPKLLVNNDFELIIAGIQPDKAYIKKIIQESKELGVLDRVHLIGAITEQDKYWYLKQTEAFLFPSISEGFGLPPIEAMRLGKPVFLSKYTSLPEIGGKAAYYFDSFVGEEMQKVLNQGFADYHDNNRKQSIIDWSKQFTWENATREYAELYKQTLGEVSEVLNVSKREKVTAIIPTFNEEKNIKQAISQVNWADEILVIDSYSTDQTEAIARKAGAKVIKRKFDNFSSQKNYAIFQAKHDWIFVLDADERIPDELMFEVENQLFNNNNIKAFWIPRTNFFMHKKVKFSGWQNDKVIRLFHKKFAQYNGRLVHEEVESKTKIGQFKSPLLHYTCNDFTLYKQKIDSYAKLKALEMYQNGFKPNLYQKYIKPLYRAIYHYVIKFGALDGKIGLKIAGINAYGMRQRYEYLKDLYRNNS